MFGPVPLVGFVLGQFDAARREIREAYGQQREGEQIAEAQPVRVAQGFGVGRVRWGCGRSDGFGDQQRREAPPPEGKPFLPEPAPQLVAAPHERRRVARAQHRARHHIAGIMNAVVNAREGDGGAERQHAERAPPVVDEGHHRPGEPVGRVRRGHAAAQALADERAGVGQIHKRPGPRDGRFQRRADQRVTEHHGEKEHRDADASAQAAAPDQQRGEQEQRGNEEAMAAEQRH